MRNLLLMKLSAAFTVLTCSLAMTFSASAAVPVGTLEGADESSVFGWTWDSDNYNHIIPVELTFYPEGSSQPVKTVTIKADHYQDKLQETIGDGYHGFSCSVDWNQFEDDRLRVTAYAVTEEDQVFLGELTFDKETKTASPVQTSAGPASEEGPGQRVSPGKPVEEKPDLAPVKETDTVQTTAPEQTASVQTTSVQTAPVKYSRNQLESYDQEIGPGIALLPKTSPKGASLGMFITTGYCSCDICSSGSNITYSGTVPQPRHTISADISIFPIGTKLMIDDIIYTVEDIGSSVTENKLDIYYETHEEALAHGTQLKEVFAVEEI